MPTVKVTRSDIMSGKYCAPSNCPIAKAIKRDLDVKPSVTGWDQITACNTYAVIKRDHKKITKFIADFDSIEFLAKGSKLKAKSKLKPFTFKVKKVS